MKQYEKATIKYTANNKCQVIDINGNVLQEIQEGQTLEKEYAHCFTWGWKVSMQNDTLHAEVYDDWNGRVLGKFDLKDGQTGMWATKPYREEPWFYPINFTDEKAVKSYTSRRIHRQDMIDVVNRSLDAGKDWKKVGECVADYAFNYDPYDADKLLKELAEIEPPVQLTQTEENAVEHIINRFEKLTNGGTHSIPQGVDMLMEDYDVDVSYGPTGKGTVFKSAYDRDKDYQWHGFYNPYEPYADRLTRLDKDNIAMEEAEKGKYRYDVNTCVIGYPNRYAPTEADKTAGEEAMQDMKNIFAQNHKEKSNIMEKKEKINEQPIEDSDDNKDTRRQVPVNFEEMASEAEKSENDSENKKENSPVD